MALNSTVGEGLVEETKSINADFLLIRGSRNQTNKYELNDIVTVVNFLYENHARQTKFMFFFFCYFLEMELLKELPGIALSMHMKGAQWSQSEDVIRQIKVSNQIQLLFKVIQFSEII